MKNKHFFILLCCVLLWASCGSWDHLRVYEKNVEIPGYKWAYDFKPQFDVNITDTLSSYNIYVTIRHTNAYRFSNIWLLVHTFPPASADSMQTRRVELPLANTEGRWLGSGMDDIVEHRIPIQQNARFDKVGMYHFSFEQNMRLNPLPYVMGVGLRIEKANP